MINSLYTQLIIRCVTATVLVMLVSSGIFTLVIKQNFDENVTFQKGYVERDIQAIYNDQTIYYISSGDNVNIRDEFYNSIRNKIQTSFPLVETITFADKDRNEIATLSNTRKDYLKNEKLEPDVLTRCFKGDEKLSDGALVHCIDLTYLFNLNTYNSTNALLSVADTTATDRKIYNWEPLAGEQFIFLKYRSKSFINWLFDTPKLFVIIIVMTLVFGLIAIAYLNYSLIPQLQFFFEQSKQVTLGKKNYIKTNYRELDSLLDQVITVISDQEELRKNTRDAAGASMIHDSKTFLLTILPTIESLIEMNSRDKQTSTIEYAEILKKARLVDELIRQQISDADKVTKHTLLDKKSDSYVPLSHSKEDFIPVTTVIKNTLKLVDFKNATSKMKVVVIPDIKMYTSYKVNEFLVRKCLQSLIFNASKYSTPDDGQLDSQFIILKIFVEKSNNQYANKLTFRVIDQGVGVPDELKDKLFKEKLTDLVFNTNEKCGLGVDLYYLNEATKDTGDHLRYVNTGNLRGSTFEYSIPLAVHDEYTAFNRPGNAKVLFDMREGVIKDQLMELVQSAGYQVIQNDYADVLITDNASSALMAKNVLLVNYQKGELFELTVDGQTIDADQDTILFDFLSQLATVQPTSKKHLSAINLDARKGNILLVEDIQEICSGYRKILCEFGFNVKDFNRTYEALDLLLQDPHCCDFYILDFNLNDNDINGGSLLNQLHKITDDCGLPRKPAIALSAMNENMLRSNEKELGHTFNYYVDKDLIKETLSNTISKLIIDSNLDIRFDPHQIDNEVFLSVDIRAELKEMRDRIHNCHEVQDSKVLVNTLKEMQQLTCVMNLGVLTTQKVESWINRIKSSGIVFQNIDHILKLIDEEIDVQEQYEENYAFRRQQNSDVPISNNLFNPTSVVPEIDLQLLTSLHYVLANMIEESTFVSAQANCDLFEKVTMSTRKELRITTDQFMNAFDTASNGDATQLEDYCNRISIYLQSKSAPSLLCTEKIKVRDLLIHIDEYLYSTKRDSSELRNLICEMPDDLISLISHGSVDATTLLLQLENRIDQQILVLRATANDYLNKVDVNHHHKAVTDNQFGDIYVDDKTTLLPNTSNNIPASSNNPELPPSPLKIRK